MSNLGSLCRLDLRSGCILNRVQKLEPGSEYVIKTPDCAVMVKGTEFGVFYDNGKTEVFVSKGIINIKITGSGTEYEIKDGNATLVNDKKEIFPIREDELILIRGFADLTYTDLIYTKSAEELQTVKNKLIESDKQKTRKTGHPGKLNLKEISVKYGKLDEVILYNGKKYTGAIISRGTEYKILTPDGIVSVQSKEVKGTRIIQ